MGVAGLWSTWRAPNGEQIESFTMLTISADSHWLMRRFHKPEDEKRMIVILPPERYDDWLRAKPEQSLGILQPYPADKLCVAAE
jgi:putative SOS response-associated peptidase YedK